MCPEIFTRCQYPNAAAQIKRCSRVARSLPLNVQVQISGVPDSSNVSYQLSVGETVDAIRSFLTPPKVAAESRITIAVVGDWGQTDNSVKTGQHMLESNSTITLIAGDLSYADGFQPYATPPFLQYIFVTFGQVLGQLGSHGGRASIVPSLHGRPRFTTRIPFNSLSRSLPCILLGLPQETTK